MDVLFWLIDRIIEVCDLLRQYSFAGVNLLVLMISGLFLSMVITVFWKGAQG